MRKSVDAAAGTAIGLETLSEGSETTALDEELGALPKNRSRALYCRPTARATGLMPRSFRIDKSSVHLEAHLYF